MIRTELKKIIFSPQYAVCILVLFVLLMIGTLGFWSTFVGDETISMLAHFMDAWDVFGNVYLVVPLLVSVPVTFLLHDELNSGYLNFSLPRAGKRRYIFTKMTAGILSGVLMIFMANLIFTAILIVLTPGSVNFYDQQHIFGETPCFFYDLAKSGKGYVPYIIWCIQTALYGGVFSALAVVASSVSRNKYVATVIPFLVFLCNENIGRYLFFAPSILRMGFKAIFFPYYHLAWLSGIPESLGIVLIWISISSILFTIVMRKRMKG